MTETIDTASERWRAICEARHWLRQGYTTASKVEELIGRIAEKRGPARAEALRADMREQWRRRAEWLGV